MNGAPRVRMREARLYRRHAAYRFPFHVAGASITGGDEVFARVRIEDGRGRSAWGAAAESPAPTWFDKTRDTAAVWSDIVAVLKSASRLYPELSADTAAGLSLSAEADLRREHASVPSAIVSLGPALFDRALLDALCRLAGVSVFKAVRGDLMGLAAAVPAGQTAVDLAGWLARRPSAPPRLAVRHTVGGVDALTEADLVQPLNDGLPESLAQVAAVYGCRYFKLKIGTDAVAGIERLSRMAAVLDPVVPGWCATLDGNEQWTEPAAALEVLERLRAARPDIAARLLYFEQPLRRDIAVPLGALGRAISCVLDEGEGTPDAFPRAHALGWRGVSAKTCKGVYRALLNGARCAAWADGSFVSGEDLNHLPGVSLQHHLAAAAMLGLAHTELNGHHYAAGFDHATAAEAGAFRAAHPDLYVRDARRTRLAIAGGNVELGSLDCAGFACGAEPDWMTLAEL